VNTPWRWRAFPAQDDAIRNKALVITFLSVAAFVVGCNKEQTTSQELDKVQAETKQAAQDMKNNGTQAQI
jgi:uncharacterized membrane protein YcjF (UPF0283 family)